MFKKSLIAFPVFLLVFSVAFPQGRGGEQGRQQGQMQGRSSGQGQYGGSDQGRAGTMEQKRIHTTQQQRDQIRSCDKMADGIRKQAKEMAQASKKGFTSDEASRQRNQIQEQVRSMEKEHNQLMNSLDGVQNQAWQEQIKNMNEFRQQLNLQLQKMDAQLNSASPDSRRIAESANQMERIMNNWRKEYKTLSSQSD